MRPVNSKHNLYASLSLLAGSCLFLGTSCSQTDGPTQPAQRTEGPGSKDYAHASFAMSSHGQGKQAYYLFEPADPAPESAPLVIFMHGFDGVNPNTYAGWIKHLVFTGKIVIFPIYQKAEDLKEDTAQFTPDAIAGIKAALVVLVTEDHVTPDLDRVAFVGHSAGAVLSANIASLASENGLPEPKALFLATPGDVGRSGFLDSLMEGMDYANIPPAVLLLAVLEENDQLVDRADTRAIIEGATRIPAENKQVLMHYADDHGDPPILANHLAPNAYEDAFGTGSIGSLMGFVETSLAIDAADYYGYWKWCDALLDAAFEDTNRAYALGGAREQTDMGMWSDGVSVKSAEVVIP